MKKILWILAAVVVAFGVGYVPQFLKSRNLSRELEDTRERLEARLTEAELQSRLWHLNTGLGLLILEVEDQNYGNAQQRSTTWFDGLSEAMSTASDPGLRQTLSQLSDRRDRVTALLTQADPDVLNLLREMYRTLASAVDAHRSDA